MNSPVFDTAEQEQIKTVLITLERDIYLIAVDDPNEPRCAEMKAFLTAIAALSPRVHVRHVPVGSDFRIETELESTRLPVVGLYNAENEHLGVRFHGVPGGQEINAFILALYNAAGPGQSLTDDERIAIDSLEKDVTIHVLVSLACHHCSATVVACQRVALLSPHVTAAMVDANLYPDIVTQFKLERVPSLILDATEMHVGSKTILSLCALLQ